MTNEEIQRRYDELERQLPTGQTMTLEDHHELERMVLGFARSLVAQAYDEAAEAAELQLGVPADAYSEDEHKLIARYIRSLKDSLVQETVSS